MRYPKRKHVPKPTTTQSGALLSSWESTWGEDDLECLGPRARASLIQRVVKSTMLLYTCPNTRTTHMPDPDRYRSVLRVVSDLLPRHGGES
jgi:hypothetical protein